MKYHPMVYVTRGIHGFFALLLVFCIVYLYYALFTVHWNGLVVFSISFLAVEGFLVAISGFDCPLRPLHNYYGDDKRFFDLFLPKGAGNWVFAFLAIFSIIGMVAAIFVF